MELLIVLVLVGILCALVLPIVGAWLGLGLFLSTSKKAAKLRDEVQGISGSTRLEAKRQRRRDGRDAGRRRPPILSESEFLARREAVAAADAYTARMPVSVYDPESPVARDYAAAMTQIIGTPEPDAAD